MVHTFKFSYSGKEYYFVWDVESGSLHNVDRVAFLIVNKIYDVRRSVKKSRANFALFRKKNLTA